MKMNHLFLYVVKYGHTCINLRPENDTAFAHVNKEYLSEILQLLINLHTVTVALTDDSRVRSVDL